MREVETRERETVTEKATGKEIATEETEIMKELLGHPEVKEVSQLAYIAS